MNIQKELQERGFLYQCTNDEVFKKLDEGKTNFYVGFDPTADSLHLGNFIGFMAAVHLMLAGNTYFALIGGATGMIGDPGGKEAERSFLSEENLRNNEKAIKIQIENILKGLEETTKKSLSFELVNNYDFYTGMGILDFLREVGKFHTVNQMMSKDTVKKRIEDPTKSISYTEFSYMLLQGYDFFKLFRDSKVTLQLGGQDQWGNLVTGVELIRKKAEQEVFAFTWPLITDASGKKFGKSEGNALFLDKKKTSPYAMYQYFMNSEDRDIERYLKMLTLISLPEIADIVHLHLENPEKRIGQKRLAYEVVKIIHGEKDAKTSETISKFLFGEVNKLEIIKGLNDTTFYDLVDEVGGIQYVGETLSELFIKAELCTSKSDFRKTLDGGGLSVNEEKLMPQDMDISDKWLGMKYLLLRKGKKNYRIVIK